MQWVCWIRGYSGRGTVSGRHLRSPEPSTSNMVKYLLKASMCPNVNTDSNYARHDDHKMTTTASTAKSAAVGEEKENII